MPLQLDDGLAKTITSPATPVGVILGTTPYMVPGQARGRSVQNPTTANTFGTLMAPRVVLLGVRANWRVRLQALR